MHKLKEYGFPVLVVYGARDWIDAAWAVREIGQNRMLGDNGKVYLIDSGHHGYVEAAAQFNDIIVHGDSPGKCGSSPVTSLKQLEEIRGPRLSSFSIS